MNRKSDWFRGTSWIAAVSIGAAAILQASPPARAQSGDPPARVGRLARLDGEVSSRDAGAANWTPAVLNFPFVSGEALWTQPSAQADLQIGSSLITLADRTEFDLSGLDDQNMVANETQGALFVDLRALQPGETYTFNTPRGAVQIATAGEYELLAGDDSTPTRVVVVQGAAQLTSGSLALRAGPREMAVATGSGDSVQGDTEPVSQFDAFLSAMLARNGSAAQTPQAAEYMTGAEDLSRYGSWQQNPDYGAVWYPQVGSDWVPYRDGSWSYVAPWGWTWIDREPWGFAPFHYGRWAQVDDRWCWVPGEGGNGGEYAQPTYAPALVDFVVAGAVAGVAAGILAASLSSGRGDVGWVPLGPREGYAPPYGGSAGYIRRLNQGHDWQRPVWGGTTVNNTTIINNNTRNVFINRTALTVVPASAMARSQPIQAVAHGWGSPAARGFQQAASVQNLRGPLPIRPVSPVAARSGFAARPPAARPLGGEPAQHMPAARFQGPVMHPGMPAAARPQLQPHGTERPELPTRPEAAYSGQRPQAFRPEISRPAPARAPGPSEAYRENPRVAPPREQPREAPAPRQYEPRQEAPRPQAYRQEAPRPQTYRPEAARPEAPRPEAFRAAPSRPPEQRPQERGDPRKEPPHQ